MLMADAASAMTRPSAIPAHQAHGMAPVTEVSGMLKNSTHAIPLSKGLRRATRCRSHEDNQCRLLDMVSPEK
jgi:hypothetical protein